MITPAFAVIARHCLLVVTILGTMMAGCIAPEGTEPALPPLGLGLAVPAHLPSPGQFIENPDDIAELEGVVRGVGREILYDCGASPGMDVVVEEMEMGFHLTALVHIAQHCGNVASSRGEPLAREAMRDGNEAELQAELHWAAVNATSRLEDAITKHAGPGDAVEASILDQISKQQGWLLDAIEAAHSYWKLYEDGRDRDKLVLTGAFLGPLGARAQVAALLTILDRYPWSEPCTAPNLDALASRVEARLHEAAALAEERGEPEHANYVTRKYGRLVKVTIPEFEYFRDQGWWWAVMARGAEADVHLAYWQNLTAPAWPTEAEAEFLLAQYRNETRTLWTEEFLFPYTAYFTGIYPRGIIDWGNDTEAGAPAFMGYMATRWPYAELDCPG